ncbi:MAG: Crp/Fnr family transcriptional regulator, partial [Candidatus Sulfotelmatobacter sp.]
MDRAADIFSVRFQFSISTMSATSTARIRVVRNCKKSIGKIALDDRSFLEPPGVAGKIVEFSRKSAIFAQGVPAKSVMYIQQGSVKLSVVNEAGKEAVVAMLGPGDFFGEGCLAGQPIRIGMASAITPATVLVIEKNEMIRLLQSDREFSDRFISYLLARNIRIEWDLVDQLFNSAEKRLARALLLLARCEKQGLTQKVLPKVSQETLSETIGTTRSRVNLFMNKFKKMGFI